MTEHVELALPSSTRATGAHIVELASESKQGGEGAEKEEGGREGARSSSSSSRPAIGSLSDSPGTAAPTASGRRAQGRPAHEATTMLFIISKYLSRGSKNTAAAAGDDRKRRKQRDREMPPASNGTTEEGGGHGCMAGCVPVRAKRAATVTTTTTTITTTSARTSRHNFVRSAASGLFPAAREFTNHESLPALPDAYSEFAAAFPQHGGLAGQADTIRDAEYGHLDRHVCLDYTGMNLFSHAQMNSSVPSTSAPAPASAWQPPFFDIAYRSASLRSQCGGDGPAAAAGGVGAAVRRRIMASLKIPEDEYTMVCTANRTSAFRLLAESYSFAPGGGGGGRKKLLAVYDYESEAVGAMAESARRRGAEVMHASFAWPSMRVHAADLRKKLLRGRRRQSGRGLFVFPLVSRMTGARYPYLWMSAAAEQGWHVVLDACALGAKDLDTLGLSLLRPDFIVCNFFKVFGENPSGFAGLFVKKASLGALERSAVARSIGIVDIVPARRWSLRDDYSTDLDNSLTFPRLADLPPQTADDLDTSCSFSGPLSASATGRRTDAAENGDTPEICEVDSTASANEEDNGIPLPPAAAATEAEEEEENVLEVECRGLDHADALGLIAIGNRLRCISNWLVVAMQRLRHPHPEHGGGQQLVRLYGPRVKFERGPSLAFNVYDWKGEKVAPALVQKLADRHCISLACGFLHNIWFADKYEADRSAFLEQRSAGAGAGEVGIHVVSASLGFLSNFEDAYRLWAFVAKFLDADFVEKERWRYTALNQKTVEV